jgi:hypothetical protein
MNLGGMEAIASQVAAQAMLDHAKDQEAKLVRLLLLPLSRVSELN